MCLTPLSSRYVQESPFVGLLAGLPLRRTSTELLALCRFDPVLAGRAGARAWSMPSLGAEDPHSVSQHISGVFSPGHPHKRSTLPELQALGVEPPSGVKPPAEAVSQLRLSSWVECVSDQWVRTATEFNFGGAPHLFLEFR